MICVIGVGDMFMVVYIVLEVEGLLWIDVFVCVFSVVVIYVFGENLK